MDTSQDPGAVSALLTGKAPVQVWPPASLTPTSCLTATAAARPYPANTRIHPSRLRSSLWCLLTVTDCGEQVPVSAMSGEIKREARHPSPASMSGKDVRAEARNFSASLTNVFLMKQRRDPQTKHLLEKAQSLIDALLAESPRPPSATPSPRHQQKGGAGGMGQLWVKLDELKRENDDLKRQRARTAEEHAGSPKSPKSHTQPGQIEPVSQDVQKIKTENDLLKAQVDKLQNTIKEHQKINLSLQDEAKRSKVALEAAQKLAKKSREDCKRLEAALTTAKTGKEPVKQKPFKPSTPSSTAPPTPSQPASSSSNGPPIPTKPPSSNGPPTPSKPASSAHSAPPTPPKPSALTGSSKPSPRPRTDNRHTENIGEKCRPSNIAVAFTTLESQEWMDAKESLEDEEEEEDVLKFLCGILMSSYTVSNVILKSVENVISHVITNPTAAVNMISDEEAGQLPPLTAELSDIIGQKLRANYDKINTKDIVDLAQKNSGSACAANPHWSHPTVRKYALECSAVTWQMAIQKPPMRMSTVDSSFNSERHRLWWSCNHLNAKGIDFFIWPCLFDYEGGNLLMKGCVHAS
ncbi:hypothetical protein ElyMa_000712200 [Elysia marginata]|uniref:Mitochondria-eating protein n=1 Tax=Elysia marginata TaxID=1093978 RepID=A0AAV4GP07_9GAST|nr:hypothetical protein ElyMa_000712200 [Elysia marginata]